MAKKLIEYTVLAPKIKFGDKVVKKGDQVKLNEDKAAKLIKKGYIGLQEDKPAIDLDDGNSNVKKDPPDNGEKDPK